MLRTFTDQVEDLKKNTIYTTTLADQIRKTKHKNVLRLMLPDGTAILLPVGVSMNIYDVKSNSTLPMVCEQDNHLVFCLYLVKENTLSITIESNYIADKPAAKEFVTKLASIQSSSILETNLANQCLWNLKVYKTQSNVLITKDTMQSYALLLTGTKPRIHTSSAASESSQVSVDIQRMCLCFSDEVCTLCNVSFDHCTCTTTATHCLIVHKMNKSCQFDHLQQPAVVGLNEIIDSSPAEDSVYLSCDDKPHFLCPSCDDKPVDHLTNQHGADESLCGDEPHFMNFIQLSLLKQIYTQLDTISMLKQWQRNTCRNCSSNAVDANALDKQKTIALRNMQCAQPCCKQSVFTEFVMNYYEAKILGEFTKWESIHNKAEECKLDGDQQAAMQLYQDGLREIETSCGNMKMHVTGSYASFCLIFHQRFQIGLSEVAFDIQLQSWRQNNVCGVIEGYMVLMAQRHSLEHAIDNWKTNRMLRAAHKACISKLRGTCTRIVLAQTIQQLRNHTQTKIRDAIAMNVDESLRPLYLEMSDDKKTCVGYLLQRLKRAPHEDIVALRQLLRCEFLEVQVYRLTHNLSESNAQQAQFSKTIADLNKEVSKCKCLIRHVYQELSSTQQANFTWTQTMASVVSDFAEIMHIIGMCVDQHSIELTASESTTMATLETHHTQLVERFQQQDWSKRAAEFEYKTSKDITSNKETLEKRTQAAIELIQNQIKILKTSCNKLCEIEDCQSAQAERAKAQRRAETAERAQRAAEEARREADDNVKQVYAILCQVNGKLAGVKKKKKKTPQAVELIALSNQIMSNADKLLARRNNDKENLAKYTNLHAECVRCIEECDDKIKELTLQVQSLTTHNHGVIVQNQTMQQQIIDLVAQMKQSEFNAKRLVEENKQLTEENKQLTCSIQTRQTAVQQLTDLHKEMARILPLAAPGEAQRECLPNRVPNAAPAEAQRECRICYCPLDDTADCTVMHTNKRDGHAGFCESCAVTWIEQHSTCPACRADADAVIPTFYTNLKVHNV